MKALLITVLVLIFTEIKCQEFFGVNFFSTEKEVVTEMKKKGYKKYTKQLFGDLRYDGVIFADYPSEVIFSFDKGIFVSGSSSVYGLGAKYMEYYDSLKEALQEKYGAFNEYVGKVDMVPSIKRKNERLLRENDPYEHVCVWETGRTRISLSYNYGRRVKLTYTAIVSSDDSKLEVINKENL